MLHKRCCRKCDLRLVIPKFCAEKRDESDGGRERSDCLVVSETSVSHADTR